MTLHSFFFFFFFTAANCLPLPEAGMPNEPLQYLSQEEQASATTLFDNLNRLDINDSTFQAEATTALQHAGSIDLSFVEFKHHDLPSLAPESEQQVVYLSRLATTLFDNTRFSYSGMFFLSCLTRNIYTLVS